MGMSVTRSSRIAACWLQTSRAGLLGGVQHDTHHCNKALASLKLAST